MQLYSQIKPNVAKKIILLANKGFNQYQICKETQKSKGVVSVDVWRWVK